MAGVVVLAVKSYHTVFGARPGDQAAPFQPTHAAATNGPGLGLAHKIWRHRPTHAVGSTAPRHHRPTGPTTERTLT
jgi:hypothetical protein